MNVATTNLPGPTYHLMGKKMGEEANNATLPDTSAEPKKDTATLSSGTATVMPLPVNMVDGTVLGVEFEIDAEVLAKAYKNNLLQRMEVFWAQQMREVGV